MQMSQAQVDEFLSTPRNAVVGTNSSSGMPHLSPVWYLWQAEQMYVIVLASTVKYRNLQRDARVAVCVDAEHPDARTVMLYGTAHLLDLNDPLVETMRWRIIEHYYESQQSAQAYYQSTKGMDWALVVVRPQRIISQDFRQG